MPLFKRVTEERYDEMLGVLPPALHQGKGFLVGEPWTHRKCAISGQDNTPAFMAFIRRNGDFFEAETPMTGAEFRALDPHRVYESDALIANDGACIAIVAREPGKPDRTLFVSAREAESRTICDAALQILRQRS